MKIRSSINICVLMIFFLFGGLSCRNARQTPKDYERMEKQLQKEEEKSIEAAKKHHLKIQSKATRQMMRDAKKRSRALNKPKKR